MSNTQGTEKCRAKWTAQIRDQETRERQVPLHELADSAIMHVVVYRSRETENMEYLKNVIIHFMCSDSVGREQLVTPVSTVLHFTPTEVGVASVYGRGLTT